MRRKTKRRIFTILMVIIIFLIFFLMAEVFSRAIMGKRLIVNVEENGLYYFKPNQEGWYSHRIRTPHARINNIGARGGDVNIDLLNKTKKYIFLGASFTFGWELEDDKIISYHFMKKGNFDNNQVINYANGGFGIDHMIGIYDFYKPLFNEKDVIITILTKDNLYKQLVPQKSTIGDVFWKVKEKSSFIAWTWATYTHLRGVFDNEVELEDEINLGKYDDRNSFGEHGEKLLGFRDLVYEDNRELIYIFYEYNYTNYSKNAKYFCEKNNLFCITDIPDSVKMVIKNGGEIHALDKGHPSSKLNNVVAKRIVSFINKNIG